MSRVGRILAPLVIAPLLFGCGRGGGGDEPAPTPDGAARPDGIVDIRSLPFTSSDGTRVTGTLAVPRALDTRGCVIWQYDVGSTKESSAVVWQGLAALGLAGFALDFRYHGDRAEGEIDGPAALRRPETFTKMVRGTVRDLRSAIDALRKQPACADKDIAYVGVGLGGAIGTILAAEDKRVRAVALVGTPGTWRGVADVADGVSALDPARYVGRIAPRPVLLVNGNADDVVPLDNARVLQAAARDPKTIVEYRGGHDPAKGPDAAGNAETVFSFLLRNVVEQSYGISGHPDGTFFLEQK